MSDLHGILIFNTQIFRKLASVGILDPSFVKKIDIFPLYSETFCDGWTGTRNIQTVNIYINNCKLSLHFVQSNVCEF